MSTCSDQLRLASSHPAAGHRAGVKPDACPESGPALCES